MIHHICTQKGSELMVAGELIRQGLDIYAPMVDDRSIDLVVRLPTRKGVAFFEVEVRTVSGRDQSLEVRNPHTPRGFDILILRRRREGQADEIFYLSAEQAKKHQDADSTSRGLELTSEELEGYREQTLERLATALRDGSLPRRALQDSAGPPSPRRTSSSKHCHTL